MRAMDFWNSDRQRMMSAGWKFSSCSCIQQSNMAWACAASAGIFLVADLPNAAIRRWRALDRSPTVPAGRWRAAISSGWGDLPPAAAAARMAKASASVLSSSANSSSESCRYSTYSHLSNSEPAAFRPRAFSSSCPPAHAETAMAAMARTKNALTVLNIVITPDRWFIGRRWTSGIHAVSRIGSRQLFVINCGRAGGCDPRHREFAKDIYMQPPRRLHAVLENFAYTGGKTGDPGGI